MFEGWQEESCAWLWIVAEQNHEDEYEELEELLIEITWLRFRRA
jgi:hypothetical protein